MVAAAGGVLVGLAATWVLAQDPAAASTTPSSTHAVVHRAVRRVPAGRGDRRVGRARRGRDRPAARPQGAAAPERRVAHCRRRQLAHGPVPARERGVPADRPPDPADPARTSSDSSCRPGADRRWSASPSSSRRSSCGSSTSWPRWAPTSAARGRMRAAGVGVVNRRRRRRGPGMRGVVTLAAVFLLPQETPQREVLQLAAFVVVAGHAADPGDHAARGSCGGSACPRPSPAEDALQAAALITEASRAGLRAAGRGRRPDDPDEVVEELRHRARAAGRTARGSGSAAPRRRSSRPPPIYRRLRLEMLARRARRDDPRPATPGRARRRGAARRDDRDRPRGVAARPGRGRRDACTRTSCAWRPCGPATAPTCAPRRW